jgi:hypothetical protein
LSKKRLKIEVSIVVILYILLLIFAVGQAKGAETFYSAWKPVSTNVNVRAAVLDSCTLRVPSDCSDEAADLTKAANAGLRRIAQSVPNPGGACTVNLKKRALGSIRHGALPASLSEGDSTLIGIYLHIWYATSHRINIQSKVCLGVGRRVR